jgi:hypothetical protein
MREWRARNPGKQRAIVERRRERLKAAGVRRHNKPDVAARYNAKSMEKYRTVPEYRARIRARQGGKLHGVTPEEYVRLRSQACAICGLFKDEPGKRGSGMHIDHDHVTGRVRGTLCALCNRGLGHFKDSLATLESAVQYLRG